MLLFVSKVFELILLNRCEQYLECSDSQFDFKAKHSTDLCIYTLKECFLDAKKAFYLINNWTLFNKLFHRGVPFLLVRILCVWYQTQRAQLSAVGNFYFRIFSY